jgi:hypothetical protein
LIHFAQTPLFNLARYLNNMSLRQGRGLALFLAALLTAMFWFVWRLVRLARSR